MKISISTVTATAMMLNKMIQAQAYPGTGYSSTRVKGPCPALNTLSNHGILPRDGQNVPTEDIRQHLEEIFSVTAMEVILGRVEDLTYINANGTKVLDYMTLFTSETDSSLVHQDLYFDPTGEPDSTLLDGLEQAAGDDGILTQEELADWRDVRLQDSLERNPEFGYTKDQHVITAFTSMMLFYGFGTDPLVNTVPIKDVMSFLRYNRFPDDFVPRTTRGEQSRNAAKDPLLLSIRQFFSDRMKLKIPKIVDTDEEPYVQQCIGAFAHLQFDIFDYEKYPNYFHEDSKVVLSQAGTYTGPKNIEEYMRFADDSSPYIQERKNVVVKLDFKEVDKRTGICTFNVFNVARIESNPDLTKETTFLQGAFYQILYDYHEFYIPEVRVHMEDASMEFLFGDVLETSEIRDFICNVSSQCPDTNVGISHETCTDLLEELPTLTNGALDGNDYGCRVLHAVFAEHNSEHCSHISFSPQEDQHGKVKCQTSSNMSSLDMFDAKDLEDWRDFLQEKQSLIDDLQGYRVLEKPRKVDLTLQAVFGLVVPMLFFVAAYTLVHTKHQDKSDQPSNNDTSSDPLKALWANKARQLWILIGVVIVSLVVVNFLVGVVVWLITETNDWERSPSQDDDNSVQDRYRGKPGVFAETVPHEILSDEQFAVYAGFMVWITVYLSGVGIEVFVWYRFLQTWSKECETLWRFVQFIFPLMLVTSLGLSLSRNFLAMPVLVMGLWKFGFPETLMHLYLAVFSKQKKGLTRVVDLLNGIGTVIHHGVASMILCMVVVGVIPPSRYVVNNALILVAQHWVAMISYGNKPLYTGCVVVFEYYFEWVIFSDFAEIYYLHWTAAWGAGTMILAHWMYFAAGLIATFASNERSNETNNVHIRGNEEMGLGADWSVASDKGTLCSSQEFSAGMRSSSMTLASKFLLAQEEDFSQASASETHGFLRDEENELEC